jgi:putative FmdB family regulatory protein
MYPSSLPSSSLRERMPFCRLEIAMPRYEFFCEDCKKPFEIILTLAEYEKGKITCPKCGGKHVHQEPADFFAVTSKKS